jgi:DNA-binding response OmpR family regulator
MKLDYNILWFEDNITWYDSMKPFIEEFLEDNGFSLVVEQRADQSDLQELINADKWDLILVDYTLSDGDKGDDIINIIRKKLYTDIVFYSQEGERNIRRKIADKGIDGVFCASRDGDEFRLKVERVIESTIKKVTDINPLRGLVMAETAEIDDLMRDILLTFMNNPKYKDKHEDLLKYICRKNHNSLKSIEKRIQEYCEQNNYKDLIKYFVFDSTKKSSTIDKMINYINDEELNTLKKVGLSYQSEIINQRNLLAHVSQEERNGVKILKSHLPNQDEIIFDANLCKKIRTEIRTYKEKFETINRLISK